MEKTNPSILSGSYWRQSVATFGDLRMLCLAAIFIALRVAVKLLTLPLGPDLHIAMDFLVNAMGSALYGPLMGLACGAVTDTISAVCFPVGGYFFPFIFVEMTGSFLFGLFLWNRNITANKLIWSKFAVSFVCNIVMNTAVLLWMYAWMGSVKSAKALFVPRAIKNLVLFPAECFLLIAFFAALLPALKRLGVYKQSIGDNLKIKKEQMMLLIILLVLAILGVAGIFWYIFIYQQ